ITFTVIILLLIAAAAGDVFYVIYHSHRPTFDVSSLHVSQFSLSPSNKLNTRFNFTITARNPNKKISFSYDPVTVSDNTTVLRTVVSATGQSVDDNSELKSDLKSKKSVSLKIRLDTKVKAKGTPAGKMATTVSIKIW
ncbi:uncharacterized protein LOC143616868, partial [Bidens hawaiensis]|uniref:uncharacterized protein LOC143616868 n=1 Tax=Bidens hawaiensis TaxID=980011 RepID=UPI00404A40F1